MKQTHNLPIHIITATDLHLLSARLNDKGEMLCRISKKGDGKVMPYSYEIIEAFADQIITEKPDVLIITGDLSYNGERESHLDLIKLLKQIQEAGIRVFIIPGNHDIEMPLSAQFSGNQAYLTDSVRYEEFYELYRSFGYGHALYKDSASFSYIAKLTDELWLAMIDVNTRDHPGSISDSTLNWLDETLTRAQELGKTILSATHQNILIHNESFSSGFIIDNHLKLLEVLERHGIMLNLSGHIHLQHLSLQGDRLSEAVTGSLAVSPHPLGHIWINEDFQLHYKIHSLDVAAWAIKNSLQDENLLAFATYSQRYFYEISAAKTSTELLQHHELTPLEIIRMTEFSAQVNSAYFAGTLSRLFADPTRNPAYLLWQKKGQNLRFRHYLDSFLLQPLKDETTFSISLRPNGEWLR